jgi:hypothetical protein
MARILLYLGCLRKENIDTILRSVIIDGVWIGNRIHWTIWYTKWLYLTGHYYKHSSDRSHVFTDVAWQRIPTADVRELSPASATSF